MRPGDVERFCTHVLEGPDPGSCWLWSGAISDDGYGRFWIGTAAGPWAVAAHRFVLATVPGGLGAIEGSIAMHWCDVPLCVRASVGPSTHLLLGTASENMADRALKKRMPSPNAVKWRRLSRAERATRSRQLRDKPKCQGWKRDLIRERVHGIDPNHLTLF